MLWWLHITLKWLSKNYGQTDTDNEANTEKILQL